MTVLTYVLGWLLFVFAQAQNSVRSNSNGLQGTAGLVRWAQLQATNIATRAFFSAIFYAWAVQFVSARLKSVGLNLDAAAIAGTAGYAANALLYQALGFLPWLRVEIGDLAPPATATQMMKAAIAADPPAK